ncbi:MAG: DUF721 domain-containing protein [Bacteroidales bacterium]|nr:DUF721 domain-containing protein [Bacteroidales bacterium]
MNPITLQDIISNFLKSNKKVQLFEEQKVMNLWYSKMGAFIVQHTLGASMKNGVLKVRLSHASLRFELNGQKTAIREQLNKEVGGEVVKDVVFY